MEMIKNLNVSIASRGIGFNRREDLDFTDDGTRFRGYDYKGLEITTCRSGERTYLSVNIGYDNDFTYNEWRATEESKLCDEFNGVAEVDLDKLIENCERIIAKRDELNDKCINEEIDMTAVKARAKFEYDMLHPFFEKAKNIKWWTLDGFKLKQVAEAMDSVSKTMWELQKDYDNLYRVEKKRLVERLTEYGYVEILYTGSTWATMTLLERM